MTVEAGRSLGRYVLVRRVGAGGMAEVWAARDEALGRTVAVKILLPGIGSDPDVRARFVREARISAGLDHPHVVQVFDVGEYDGSAYLVSQLMEGGRLTDRLVEGKVPWALAVRWLGELASALDYAHSRGVVHRDVKPANVLFDTASRTHLADFGIAKSLEEASTLTRDGQVIGTPAYMSPEQAMGRDLDGRSDQYALGMIGYRLATGKLPWEKLSFPIVIQKTIFEVPPSPSVVRPELPAGIDQVFAKVLAKEPDGRFACCADFVSALAEIVTPASLTPRSVPAVTIDLLPPLPGTAIPDPEPLGEPEAAEEPVAPQPRKGPGRKELFAGAAVALALLVVAAGAFFWIGGRLGPAAPAGSGVAAAASPGGSAGLTPLAIPTLVAVQEPALLKINVDPYAEVSGPAVESLPATERVTPLKLELKPGPGEVLELRHPEFGSISVSLDPLRRGGTWLLEGSWGRRDEIRLKEEK